MECLTGRTCCSSSRYTPTWAHQLTHQSNERTNGKNNKSKNRTEQKSKKRTNIHCTGFSCSPESFNCTGYDRGYRRKCLSVPCSCCSAAVLPHTVAQTMTASVWWCIARFTVSISRSDTEKYTIQGRPDWVVANERETTSTKRGHFVERREDNSVSTIVEAQVLLYHN